MALRNGIGTVAQYRDPDSRSKRVPRDIEIGPGVEIHDADLGYANLRGANLRDSDLRNVNFYGADLSYADLRDAKLTGCSFSFANLTGADIRGAMLYNTHFDRALVADMTVDQFSLPVIEAGIEAMRDSIKVARDGRYQGSARGGEADLIFDADLNRIMERYSEQGEGRFGRASNPRRYGRYGRGY
jgi:hypothetical protein